MMQSHGPFPAMTVRSEGRLFAESASYFSYKSADDEARNKKNTAG
jgi:hypothetical protein